MKVSTQKGFSLNIEIDDESIIFYSDRGYSEASFEVEHNDSHINITIEQVEVSSERQGIYTTIIDTIIYNDDFHKLLKENYDRVNTAYLISVSRTEKACNFWLKRGYGEKYNEKDHLNGWQEIIQIEINL